MLCCKYLAKERDWERESKGRVSNTLLSWIEIIWLIGRADCMSHYQLGHFRRLSTRSRRQRRRRLRACTHISPDIGADIKRLLNKFKLIDKHTESQMVAASAAAADGNYRHVLCSNQRSSRHLVKQFAGQMQPNQSRQRMPHAACHIAQVQPTHCPPVDRSGPV